MSEIYKLISVKEASLVLRKSEKTIYRWINLGSLKSYKIDGKTWVDLQEALTAERDMFLKTKPKAR